MVKIMEENKCFEITRIPKPIQELIKKTVVQKLGVENQFKLNDRFEGVYYMNKQLRRILSLFVIGKTFNLDLIDNGNVLKSKSVFEKNEARSAKRVYATAKTARAEPTSDESLSKRSIVRAIPLRIASTGNISAPSGR